MDGETALENGGFAASQRRSPGLVVQLVRVSSQYGKFAGSIPGQVTCKNQPMNT